MLDLVTFHHALLGHDLLQKEMQLGNVPLAVAQCVEQPAQGVGRADPEGRTEGAAGREHTEILVEHQERLADRIDDRLREGARLLGPGEDVVVAQSRRRGLPGGRRSNGYSHRRRLVMPPRFRPSAGPTTWLVVGIPGSNHQTVSGSVQRSTRPINPRICGDMARRRGISVQIASTGTGAEPPSSRAALLQGKGPGDEPGPSSLCR
jgi:hypothetical protein